MKIPLVSLLAPLASLVAGHESEYGWKSSSPALSYAANTTSLLDIIIARGYLLVGTTGDYKPFSYKIANTTALPNGTAFNTTYIGADIDMAQSLSNALSLPLPPVFVPTVWANLTQDLGDGNFDIAMGGISITLARAKTAMFSTPVLRGGKTGCIRCSDRAKYTDVASLDVAGVKIAANPGGTNEAFDRANFVNAEIVMVENNNAVYQAVVGGTADAMVSDKIEVELQVNLHPNGTLCMVNEVPWTFEELGYLVPRDWVWKSFVDTWVSIQVEGGGWNETLGVWMEYQWPAV